MTRSSKRRRRIAVITGTRAEYGLFQSVLTALSADPRVTLQLVVTGMHLVRHCGYTVRQIAADGWPIAARVPMQRGDDRATDQAEGLARGVAGLSRFLVAAQTDIVLVLGDRIEAMAGALAAVTTGRTLAHIHGGDVAEGDFDDALRHAVTKLAHLHFAASTQARRRIIRLGEPPQHVHCVGAVGLDRLRVLLAEVPPRPMPSGTALVVYHAAGRTPAYEQRVMTQILAAVRQAGLRRRIVHPNTDRGHTGVLRAIERHAARYPQEVEVARSLPRDEYLRALLGADVLIGNSSSGVIEAPLAGTASVNVGPRQAGRQPGGPAVLDCDATPAAIRAALARALRLRPRRGGRSVYGDGHAGARIARLLATVPLTAALRRKRLTY